MPTPKNGQTHSKQFGFCQRIVLIVFNHFVGLVLKGLWQRYRKFGPTFFMVNWDWPYKIVFPMWSTTSRKKKPLFKIWFSKYEQIKRYLRLCLHLLKKSLKENFIDFCKVTTNPFVANAPFFYSLKTENRQGREKMP